MRARLIRLAIAYILGEASLDELQRLLLDISWNQDGNIEAETLEVAGALELAIAEYTRGDRTEDELKQVIGDAISDPVLHVNAALPVQSRLESRSVTVRQTAVLA